MTVESEILKPRSDKRDYRRIVLPNSLEVLLISDPDTDKCAASMDVNVGSFSDPEGLEGLAHFLEHMLFFASEKYPLENSYSKYITEHGGATNAFTDSEHTNFYFDVNSDCFEEALDRFAQFFIRPLMSPDATLREIKAVDSENQKNLLSDAWRMDQLQKHLSAKSHPYHKFGTGNWDTLEVRPKEKGMDIRRELIKFYEENYSANLMHLVVYGKKSLDKIQNMVEDMFQEIRNTERSCSNFPGHPCTSEHLQILIKAVRIKQGHKLRVIWPITPSIHHYKEGPCMYLSHLIGHEGEGSLFFLLKRLGWATGLSAGEADWTKTYSFFSVSIDLTDAGYEHVEDMLGLLFQYIFLLQKCGVEEWIFDELSAVCEIWFHFQDKIPPIDYVANLASNLRLYPPHDWLVASSLPSKFKPEIIQMVLTELTPNNVRILLESKKFEGSVDMVEPWYGTAFAVEKITDDMIQKWITFAPNDQLNIPAPNIFIPSDLALKKVPEKVEFPVLLRKSSFSRIWYKSDTMFFTPKAFVKIDFNCPESCHSPEASVLTDIFTRLLMDYLNEYAYDAQVAGLYYGIHHTDTGFQVILVGYNHKMRILLETIIEKVAQFEVKPDRFSVIKETLTRDYQNFKFQQPYQQAMYYCSLILEDHTWPWSEQLEALPHLEANDLTKFFPCMLSKAFLECYVAGNIEPNEAESLIQHMEDIFFKGPLPLCKPLFPSQHLTNRIIKLERCSSNFYPIEGLNPSDENSALHYYIQVDRDDFKLNVKLQLFVLVAKEAAFHQLRSVEQLGYITVLMPRSDSGIQGIQFIVQSTVKDSAQLDERVEAFLKMFESKLHAMTNDEYKEGKMKLRRSSLIKGGRTFATKDPRSFASNINALINMKLEKHKNLREESRFYWREIVDGTLKFDRRECEVAALRELTQQDLIDFFNEYIKVGAPQRKKLSLQIYGALHSSEFKAAMYGEISSQSVRIDDIFSFRRSQALYGSFRGGGGHVKL